MAVLLTIRGRPEYTPEDEVHDIADGLTGVLEGLLAGMSQEPKAGTFAYERWLEALHVRRASTFLDDEDAKVGRCTCGAWTYDAERCRSCRRGLTLRDDARVECGLSHEPVRHADGCPCPFCHGKV